MLLVLELPLTDAQVLERVPRDWGRVDWPDFDAILLQHFSFGIALERLIVDGVVKRRTVVEALHGKTNETRVFTSDAPDWPGSQQFNTGGMAFSPRRPWYHCLSFCEWRIADDAASERREEGGNG